MSAPVPEGAVENETAALTLVECASNVLTEVLSTGSTGAMLDHQLKTVESLITSARSFVHGHPR